MLKLNYTDIGLYMERTTASLEGAIAQRIILAMRLGETLAVEPSYASFLVPADVVELEQLEAALKYDGNNVVGITQVDAEWVEISLSGSWVAATQKAEEGMFVTMMSDFAERCIYELWQISETQVSSLA